MKNEKFKSFWVSTETYEALQIYIDLDLVFWPRKGSEKPLMIVELKWNKKVEGAIAQIKKNHYVQAIEHYGGEILMVGINYDVKSKKHECVIEKYEK